MTVVSIVKNEKRREKKPDYKPENFIVKEKKWDYFFFVRMKHKKLEKIQQVWRAQGTQTLKPLRHLKLKRFKKE